MQRSDQRTLDRAQGGVIAGLGFAHVPCTICVDGAIVVVFYAPVTRRLTFDVWNAVNLATQRTDIVMRMDYETQADLH